MQSVWLRPKSEMEKTRCVALSGNRLNKKVSRIVSLAKLSCIIYRSTWS